jgi:vanillate O-demethylase monooxygenase subunit
VGELDHWHPVARSEALGRAPLGVRLCGEEVVIFRTEGGGLGALRDACPHRGMRLSLGRVAGERLVCPYHGWAWAPDGSGCHPSSAKIAGCAHRFEVVERLGAVWVRAAGADTSFPELDFAGYEEIARLEHEAPAPLELVLDNFIEVEHTGNVHLLFGYAPERMAEVSIETDVSEDRVHVVNRGPQRYVPAPIRKLFHIEPGDVFVDEWTTYFSPVHTVYDHYWIDGSGRRRDEALRTAVFFTPVGPERTGLFSFAYGVEPPWARGWLGWIARPLTRVLVDLEIRRDVRVVGDIADRRTSLRGNALGRFDKPLVAARKRIERIYRGRAGDELVSD